jgi:hypothetical protein
MSKTSLKCLSVERDVIRLFGQGDIANHGLVRGWALPEERHIWNNGFDATMIIEASLPTGPTTVFIEGVPYLYGKSDWQEITLFANGYRVGWWHLTQSKQIILTARIEPEQWFNRQGRGFLNLTWHLPNSACPVDLGDGEDSRLLGFAFRTLSLSEATVEPQAV